MHTIVKTKWAVFLLSLLVLLAMGFPSLQSWLMQTDYHGRWLDEPAPDFRILQPNGLGLDDFAHQYVWVYFGYLHCDGFCQQQWVTLFHVMQQLHEQPVKVVLITLDPERDSAQDLDTLADNLGDQFVAIRADSIAKVQTLANAYHAPFQRAGEWHTNRYSIDHSGDIFLIAPDKNIKLIYSGDHWRYHDLVEDYTKLAKHY
jgi:protein SCO1/2